MTIQADPPFLDPKDRPSGAAASDAGPPAEMASDWAGMTWQDIQAIALALEECHPDQALLPLTNPQLAVLVSELPGFAGRPEDAPDATLSAIVGAWIAVREGEDDSSPFEFLA